MESDSLLVQTLLSAISPGTESLIYRGEFPPGIPADDNIPSLSHKFEYPFKFGYSAVGKVVSLGKDVNSRWMGRLVFAFQPHESCFIAKPETLILIPEDISLEDSAFLPNMETAINFLMDGSPLIGENVAVFGQGIVGLLTTGLLAQFPLARLVTFDCYPLRRQISHDLGAHICLEPRGDCMEDQLKEHLPNGADLAYELSGSPQALDQAVRATGFAGRVVIGSWYGCNRINLDLGSHFHRSRIRLISSQVSSIAPEFAGRWTKRRRFDTAWQMIRRLKPARFITHRFPIERAAEAYHLLDRNPERTIQILLTYNE